jgi:hypothetical protein
VLERQLELREPLAPSELRHAVTLDGEEPIAPAHYAAIARRIGVAAAINQPEPAGISSA